MLPAGARSSKEACHLARTLDGWGKASGRNQSSQSVFGVGVPRGNSDPRNYCQCWARTTDTTGGPEGASHQSKTKPGGTQDRGGRNHHHPRQEDQLTVKCFKPHGGMKEESADSTKRRIRAPQEANIKDCSINLCVFFFSVLHIGLSLTSF